MRTLKKEHEFCVLRIFQCKRHLFFDVNERELQSQFGPGLLLLLGSMDVNVNKYQMHSNNWTSVDFIITKNQISHFQLRLSCNQERNKDDTKFNFL